MKSEACVVILCLVALVHSATVFPTYSDDGFEVIWLDSPSFLSQLYHSHTDALLYIYGENRLRLVTTAPNFSVTDNPDADWLQPFISLFPFHNGADLWGVGPSFPSDYSNFTEGYTLPLALVGPNTVHSQRPPGLEGSTFYNVFVDPRNTSDVISYFVGWIQVNATSGNNFPQVALGVVRTHVNINAPWNLRQFTYNPAIDVVYLAYNRYAPYSQHFKPHIHFSNTTNTLVVADPATNVIYTIKVPGSQVAFGSVQFNHVKTSPPAMISSSFLHIDTNLIYLGLAAQGVGNGSIVAVDLGTLTVQHSLTFASQFMSNPRAITIDDSVDTIYVGFEGGDIILKMDYLFGITGFQRVPDYLTHLEAAAVGNEHVYFVTNEQHSKVIRVKKADFCTDVCPYLGYCKADKCVCPTNYRLSSRGMECEIAAIQTSKEEKGAAVALGVLFALALVAGAFGWVLYWRARKGGYQAV